MTARGKGRPPTNGGAAVSPARILSEALAILDAGGVDDLTMRALATCAGINPMTIYHHFGDRDGLLKALAEKVYADVAFPETGEAFERARCLLTAYYAKVVRHPSLTLAIFGRPSVLPDQARRITGELAELLGECGRSSRQTVRWTHILIDYTHGAALAAATHDGSADHPSADAMRSEFEHGLAELVEAFARSADCKQS
jgi:AcrR family transcriptional regulator